MGPHGAAKRPGARGRSGRPGQRSIRTGDWLREAERLLLHAVVKVNGRGSRHGYLISLQTLNSFRKVHRNVHVIGRDWRVSKSVLLEGLPRAGKYIGFVIGVEPRNT